MIYLGEKILESKYDGLVFGNENQLTVLGYFGSGLNYHKYLVCECSICKKDFELFGKGLFTSTYGNIRLGNLPCGCGKKRSWTEQQQRVRATRACEGKGFSFVDFAEAYKGDRTKVILDCDIHGVWQTSSLTKLVQNRGCPKCAIINNGLKRRLDDEVVVNSILASGAFHPDTEFRRSERKTIQGNSNFWYVDCPECGTTGEGWIGNLQNGSRPCECVKGRQTEAYINFIKDNNTVVAVKFGISRNSLNRLYWINHNTMYDVENYAIFSFPDTASTRKAEIECKRQLTCGVVSKAEMPDGYSETTTVSNLDKIIKIYQRNGGICSYTNVE